MAKPVETIAQIIDRLNAAESWSGSTVTFSMTGLTRTDSNGNPLGAGGDQQEAGDIVAMTAAEKAYAVEAFGLWDDLISTTLQLSNDRNAKITFNYTTDTNAAQNGVARRYSDSSNATIMERANVWFTNNAEYTDDTSFGAARFGTHAQNNYLHEIGHTLGLDHPGPYDSIGGAEISYDLNAQYFQDTEQYTIMSYWRAGANGDGSDHTDRNGTYIFPQTPMLHDIAAAQQTYRADMTTRTGDTVYGFGSTPGIRSVFNFAVNTRPVLTIWDANGTDTLDVSGFDGNQTIDLYQGHYSSVGNRTSSEDTELDNNVAIAAGATIERANGGSGNDTMIGNDGGNRLNGNGGADTLYGNGGYDTLIGGAGGDALNGGDGNDTASYETSGAAVTVSLGDGKAVGGDADGDTLTSIESVTGSAFDDSLNGSTGFNFIVGGGGNDQIDGRGGGDFLYGGSGDDYMVARLADDLNGNEGKDTVDFAATSDTFVSFDLVNGARGGTATGVLALRELEVFLGESGNDTMLGDGAANTFIGEGGDDDLQGRGGGDTLIGGAGGDKLDGGDGFDAIDYSSSANGVSIDLADGKVGGGDAAGDTIVSIEDVSGSGQVDTLRGNDVSNVIRGGGGTDYIDGRAGFDYVYGDAGDDQITAGVGAALDFIDGGAGYDTVTLEGNGVTLDLPTMNNPNVFNGGFRDVERFIGTAGGDTMTGDGAGNWFSGMDGVDSLDGGEGNDALEGGLGNDAMSGGDGEDTVWWTAATGDIVVGLDAFGFGMPSQDVAGIGQDIIIFIENIQAGSGNDRITGNVSANKFWGNAGTDALNGGGGDDTLDGGAGADAMAGGLGNDIFYVDNAGDAVAEIAGAGSGYDTVRTTLSSYALADNVERFYADSVAGIAIAGNALANRIYGNNGNDKFRDYAGGADSFSGGNGSDSMYFTGTGAAVLNFATGVHGGSAAGDAYSSIENFFGSNTAGDAMMAGTGRAIFNGQGGNDTLTGGANIDSLYGGAGLDRLSGGAGTDALYGGKDNDTLTGGAARDYFVYAETAASGGWATDIVTDWQDGLDVLKFASPVADAFSDFAVTGNGTASVTLALIGAASNAITLNGAGPITITAADFLFF